MEIEIKIGVKLQNGERVVKNILNLFVILLFYNIIIC